MAIPILEERKKMRRLTLVLAAVLLLTAIIVWRGIISKQSSPLPSSVTAVQTNKIEIDWNIVKSPVLETLLPFEEISPFKGTAGRKNPFLPY